MMATSSVREFQVFVKPVGPVCNLGCTYCYYLDKDSLYVRDRVFHMTDGVLENYIRQQIEATTEPVITFSWHGGEPMRAGLRFYRKAVALQQKVNNSGKRILNGMQTNGTLVNEEWCRFLATEKFAVGLSIDGPEKLHDTFRLTKDGKPTFKQVMRGYDHLVIHGLEPEILCVVNAVNVKHPVEVYRFFRHLGVRFMTFIPLVERRDGKTSGVSDQSVPAGEFGDFLCAAFDEWVRYDIGQIKIQIVEEATRLAFNQDHTLCIFKRECGGVPVVEHNGDLFSCDHFVGREHFMGNISKTTLAEMIDSNRQKAFGQAKRNTLPRYCLACEVRDMCNGECPKNRFINTPDGEPGLNYLCAGYRKFFNHCRLFVEAVAKTYKNC